MNKYERYQKNNGSKFTRLGPGDTLTVAEAIEGIDIIRLGPQSTIESRLAFLNRQDLSTILYIRRNWSYHIIRKRV